MHRIFLLLLMVFLAGAAQAQEKADHYAPCGTDYAYQKAVEKDPSIRKIRSALEQNMRSSLLKDDTTTAADTTEYIIPVVFHIVHNYGSEFLTYDRIQRAMDDLNLNFRPDSAHRQNVWDINISDTSSKTWRDFIGVSNFEFRLAGKDPEGNPTTGVTYHVDPRTSEPNTSEDCSNFVKDLVPAWPTNEYLNIWLVDELALKRGNDDECDSRVVGVSAFPGMHSIESGNDGIINEAGNLGGLENQRQTTITHEVGHFFNLLHPWGSQPNNDNCTGSDEVDDTPVTEGIKPGNGCEKDHPACDRDSIFDYRQDQNYMDYGHDRCQYLFTKGQVDRMHAAAFNSGENAGERNNLWKEANLIKTGVNDGFQRQPVKPTADFHVSPGLRTQCENSNISFKNFSYGGEIDSTWSFQWIFEGGEVESDTADEAFEPFVTYTQGGTYDVTLIATNEAGSDTTTKEDYIRIGQGIQEKDYNVSFEVDSFPDFAENPNRNWSTQLPPNEPLDWELTDAAASEGSKSLRIKNNGLINGNATVQRSLISPDIDLSFLDADSVFLYFDYAYAQRNSDDIDRLEVEVSRNCGATFQRTGFEKQGQQLSTTGLAINPGIGNEWAPGDGDWETAKIDMGPWKTQTTVSIKFEMHNDGGNPLYLDNVRIEGIGPVGLDPIQEQELGFQVVPNPYSGDAQIRYDLPKNREVSLQVFDALGRQQGQTISGRQLAGQHSYRISELVGKSAKGMYFVRLQVGQQTFNRKVIAY